MRVFLPVLMLGLLVSAPRQAPAPNALGSVSGVVVDSANAVVTGATVELLLGTRVERTATTTARGEFRFDKVPFGGYGLHVTKPGFVELTSRVTVDRGTPAVVRLTLKPQVVLQHKEQVQVSAEAPRIDAMTANRAQPSPAMASVGRGGGGLMPSAPPFNTEAYDKIDENRFKRVADDPLSTFSVDVDTASYSNVRRFLNDGALPPPDAVRIEEMINYFRFNYGDATNGAPFSVTTEVAACPWNPRHRLALVGIQAKRLPAEETPPRNLVFLIDVSGSMMPANKLPLVKTAMRMLADTLSPADRVAIVVYAGASGVVLPSTPGDRKMKIQTAIAELQSGGSTNGGAGIRLAYDIASKSFIKGGINRVILATDGDFNVGVTNQGELIRLIEAKRETGIFLSVLGVGTGNLKDSTMEKLADRGNGNYAYLDSLHEARRVLIAEAGATLVTVAKDVKIQVEFNPRTVGAYKLIGYENRMLQHQDFNDDRKDAGDIGAGHTVTALYEIIPPGESLEGGSVDELKYQSRPRQSAASSAGELMTVKLRYKLPDGDASKLLSRAVSDRGEAMSANLGFASAVAQFGMLLRKSELKGQSTWANAQALARRYRGDDPDGYRAELVRLMELAQALDVQSGDR